MSTKVQVNLPLHSRSLINLEEALKERSGDHLSQIHPSNRCFTGLVQQIDLNQKKSLGLVFLGSYHLKQLSWQPTQWLWSLPEREAASGSETKVRSD